MFEIEIEISSSGSSGRVRGGEKHEIYAAAFGDHLFYDLFSQGRGGPWPPRPPLDPLLISVKIYSHTQNLNRWYSTGCLQTINVNIATCSGGSKDQPPPQPPGPNSFNFMQFWGEFWQNRMLAPPGGLAPPPRGNPGSVTEVLEYSLYFNQQYSSNWNTADSSTDYILSQTRVITQLQSEAVRMHVPGGFHQRSFEVLVSRVVHIGS